MIPPKVAPVPSGLLLFSSFLRRKTSRRSLNKLFVLHIPNLALPEVCVNWNSRFGLHFERWTVGTHCLEKDLSAVFFLFQDNHETFINYIVLCDFLYTIFHVIKEQDIF